jgi:hypothetical protein
MSGSAASRGGDGHTGGDGRYRPDVNDQRIEPVRSGRSPRPASDRPGRIGIRHPGRVAIVAGGLFVVLALVVGAITSADTSDLQTEEPVPAGVESFSPAQGAKVPPNSALVVDLGDELVGEFTVCAPLPTDCIPIPLDQTRVVPATGQVTFKPTEDTDITEWPPGPVRVTVDYHLRGSVAAEAGNFTWTFVSTA